MDEKKISDFFTKYRGAIIGGLIGLGLFIMLFEMGFFKTLFLAAFVLVGVYFGSKRENWERFMRTISNLFPDNRE